MPLYAQAEVSNWSTPYRSHLPTSVREHARPVAFNLSNNNDKITIHLAFTGVSIHVWSSFLTSLGRAQTNATTDNRTSSGTIIQDGTSLTRIAG